MSRPSQIWITRTPDIDAAVSDARLLWPQIQRDGQVAGQIVRHWHNQRQPDGRQQAQERTEAALSAINKRLARIERRLGIEEGEEESARIQTK